ncbi:penicillin-binding protein [Actinoplanes philippinensis]|nr:penicillin-binding protein [Actinoplanes philippinensis]
MIACLASLLPASPVAAAGGEPATERYLHEYMARIKAPGLAFAVIRGDRVIQRGAWGVDGDGRPITTTTPFMLGSTSKSFTALAVTQLADSGRIDLDTAAVTYLPWLRLGDETTARTVTVRHLLTHTSGLPQVWSSDLTDRYDNDPGGLARSVRDLAGLRPIKPLGQGYAYSDANYMILGALVENVTGDSFGGYLRRHVLDPLGMTHAAATAAEATAVGLPAGHRYYLGRPQRFATPFDTAGVPYGFLAAGLDDLTRYTMFQLNGDPRILGADALTRMHTGTADTGHGTYGFGWQNSTLDGVGARIVWHAGATPNYFSHIVLAPDAGLAVVVLTNIYGLPMDGPLSSGAFNVARLLLGGVPADAAEDPMHRWALIGLLGAAALLAAAVVRSWIRPVRRVLAPVAGCAALAGAAGWLTPSLWNGADLAKLRLWAPDVGHAILAVAALCAVLALTRLYRGLSHRRPRAGSPAADPVAGTPSRRAGLTGR